MIRRTIHSLKTGYTTWCGRNINRHPYMDCSTPGRPPTCQSCIYAIKKARQGEAAIAAAKEA